MTVNPVCNSSRYCQSYRIGQHLNPKKMIDGWMVEWYLSCDIKIIFEYGNIKTEIQLLLKFLTLYWYPVRWCLIQIKMHHWNRRDPCSNPGHICALWTKQVKDNSAVFGCLLDRYVTLIHIFTCTTTPVERRYFPISIQTTEKHV